MDGQKLGSPLLTMDDRIEELEMILAGVMMEVDQWCSRDDYELGEVERAKAANDRIFDIIRNKDRIIKDLKYRLEYSEKRREAAEFVLTQREIYRVTERIMED